MDSTLKDHLDIAAKKEERSAEAFVRQAIREKIEFNVADVKSKIVSMLTDAVFSDEPAEFAKGYNAACADLLKFIEDKK